MTVKGSKQYRLMVVPYRSGRHLLSIMLLTLLAIALAAGGVLYGYQQARQDHQRVIEEWTQLQEQLHQQQEELEKLRQQSTNSEVGSAVDRQALEELRKQILQLNDQISELTESNNFYRQLIDPSTYTKGLAIGSWEVFGSKIPNHFRYKLLVQQFSGDHHTLTGKINVTFSGKQGGTLHNYALSELSPQQKSIDIPLKLRYYQAVEGDLILPPGFEPERVDVAVLKSGAEQPLAQGFGWVVKNSIK